MMKLQDVSKVYPHPEGEVCALDGVSVAVDTGEFVVVRGASGSGKSTLLLTIGGMVRPSSGQVLMDGEDIYRLSAGQRARLRARRVGFVFQMFHLVPYLGATENVLVTNLAGSHTSRDQAAKLLTALGLGERLAHLPAELSTGERQRVALARALIKQPDIILADEPTGNLDPDISWEIVQLLSNISERGTTVVCATHDRYIVDGLRKRVVTLVGGTMVRDDRSGGGYDEA